MARTNLEERVFGDCRLHKFAQLMGWHVREALGCLGFLWHDSQEQLRTHGTASEIADWCWEASRDVRDRIVSNLQVAGFIVPDGGGFLIKGNAVQIENRMAKVDRAAKGGKATKEKWERLKAHGSKPSSKPSGIPGSNQAQFNSIQFNSESNVSDSTCSDFDRSIAKEWAAFAQDQVPTMKIELDDWSSAIRLMRERDGLTEAEVTEVFGFIRSDPFWSTKALSPVSVRKRSHGRDLTKLENIRLQMKPSTNAGERDVDRLYPAIATKE